LGGCFVPPFSVASAAVDTFVPPFSVSVVGGRTPDHVAFDSIEDDSFQHSSGEDADASAGGDTVGSTTNTEWGDQRSPQGYVILPDIFSG
jgi:hypothetical protein